VQVATTSVNRKEGHVAMLYNGHSLETKSKIYSTWQSEKSCAKVLHRPSMTSTGTVLCTKQVWNYIQDGDCHSV